MILLDPVVEIFALADADCLLVEALQKTKVNDLIFPGEKKDSPLSAMAFAMLMRRMKVEQYTAHRFRSAFRD